MSTLPPDQRVVKILSAPKALNKLCEVCVLVRSVADAEIEAHKQPNRHTIS